MWIVATALALGALWDGLTTFFGLTQVFGIGGNGTAAQLTFAVVVSMVVMGFMIATHLIWSFDGDDVVSQILKWAWGLSLVIDLYTSYEGNKQFVFNNRIEGVTGQLGLLAVTLLITVSTMLLSRLILSKDARGKGFLY